jgi:hypothetical protein
MIQITNTNNQLRLVDSDRIEFYKFEEITNVAWNKSAENQYYVLITFDSEYLLRIELSRITNQPTWTNNLLGAQAAVAQISLWMNAVMASIVSSLTQILATLQLDKDFEAFFVKDALDVIWLEVRTLDIDTGAWTILYYLPGSTVPGLPTLPVIYESPNAMLALILAELIAQTAILTAIEVDTTSIDATLTTQLDVPLSTVATEITLASVLLELQGINLDTNGLSQEATQLLIQALLTTIDADTSNLDVALSTVSTEITLAALLTAFNAEDFATQTTLATRLSKADFEARINTLGQKLMAASTPVVLASDQSAIPVTLTGGGVQTLTSSIAVANGAVALGAAVVSFVTSVGFTGTINGIARTASNQYIFEASSSKSLPAISYTITAGSIELDILI